MRVTLGGWGLLVLYLCDVFRALINSLVCWFCMSALGHILFQTARKSSRTTTAPNTLAKALKSPLHPADHGATGTWSLLLHRQTCGFAWSAWLYGVHRTCRNGSSFMWHQPCQRWKYTTTVDIKKKKKKKKCNKKLIIYIESHASARERKIALYKKRSTKIFKLSLNWFTPVASVSRFFNYFLMLVFVNVN